MAFSTLGEVINDYCEKIKDGIITVGVLVVGGSLKADWLKEAAEKRPTRDLIRELDEQDKALLSMDFDGVYPLTWRLEDDQVNYLNLYKSIIAAKRR